MTYSQKLKDPRWQKKRLEILQKDNWTCQCCGNTEDTLHVHHIEYYCNKKPWEYDNSCLITLCDSCHSFCHKLYLVDKSEFAELSIRALSHRYKNEKNVDCGSICNDLERVDFLIDEWGCRGGERRFFIAYNLSDFFKVM